MAETDTDLVEETVDTADVDAPEADVNGDDSEQDDAWDPGRARAKIRKLNSEAEGLRKRLAEAPKADDVNELKKSNESLAAHNLRLEVGYELGLPFKVARRLQGATREELLADAEELLADFAPVKEPPSGRPKPRVRGEGAAAEPPEERDTRKIGDRMFRR